MAADIERLLEALRKDPEQLAQLRELLGAAREDRLEAGLDRLTEAQALTEANLATLIERVDAIAANLATLTQRVDTLTERVDAIAANLATLTERVDAIAANLAALTQRVDALTQRVDALTQRVDALTERVDAIAVNLATLTERVDTLAGNVATLTERMGQLTDRVGVMADHVGELRGEAVERRYREKGVAYFAPIAQGLHVLTTEELDRLLNAAVADGQIDEDEKRDVLWADVVLRGKRDGQPVYLVVEVSGRVETSDVQRAHRRAGLLARVETATIPVVAGNIVDVFATQDADSAGVWQVTNGQVVEPTA